MKSIRISLKGSVGEVAARTAQILQEQQKTAACVLAFAADLPEFTACLTMLKSWESYTLKAFDCPYSNGFTEGINNKIKVLKRIAFGYRSFRNFRTRILCTTNA